MFIEAEEASSLRRGSNRMQTGELMEASSLTQTIDDTNLLPSGSNARHHANLSAPSKSSTK